MATKTIVLAALFGGLYAAGEAVPNGMMNGWAELAARGGSIVVAIILLVKTLPGMMRSHREEVKDITDEFGKVTKGFDETRKKCQEKMDSSAVKQSEATAEHAKMVQAMLHNSDEVKVVLARLNRNLEKAEMRAEMEAKIEREKEHGQTPAAGGS
jgi:hypothetical protein